MSSNSTAELLQALRELDQEYDAALEAHSDTQEWYEDWCERRDAVYTKIKATEASAAAAAVAG